MLVRTMIAFLVSLLVGSAAPVFAQPPGRGGPGGGGTPYGRLYNPRTVESVTGEITAVEKVALGRGGARGIHLVVKTDKGESLPVHLGPAWYVEEQDVTLKPGDKVQARGSRITFQGKPALIAAEVTKDGKTLHLRDENGVPAWAGWRRRGR